MFIFILFMLATTVAGIISPENIVSVIIGTLGTWGVTNWIKNLSGLYGFGATVLAVVIAFVVAILAVVVQMVFTGDFSTEAVAGYAVTIFSLATIAYQGIKSQQK